MKKLGTRKVGKSSSFNNYDSFIFFVFVITTVLFKLKIVVSIYSYKIHEKKYLKINWDKI